MTLADKVLRDPGPPARLILADPDAPPPTRKAASCPPRSRSSSPTPRPSPCSPSRRSRTSSFAATSPTSRRDSPIASSRRAARRGSTPRSMASTRRPTCRSAGAGGCTPPPAPTWRPTSPSASTRLAASATPTINSPRPAWRTSPPSGEPSTPPTPYAAGRGPDGRGSACLAAAGIAREIDRPADPGPAGRRGWRLGWLLHAGLVDDDGDRVGGPVATADLALDRAGALLLPPWSTRMSSRSGSAPRGTRAGPSGPTASSSSRCSSLP